MLNTYLRWKRYSLVDVRAVLFAFLDSLERWPYAVATGADRFKEPADRGMPIEDRRREPAEYTIEFPNGDEMVISIAIRRKPANH
jgi:hypothetical protein